MNIKRPLVPGWLKTAEQKLLLNKPGVWSTRIHLVLYYGVLFILVLAALCFLEPVDVRDDSTTEFWIGFVSVIAGIGLIVWLIYLLRFNVFKKYGIIHPLNGLITFVLYFIATGTIVLSAYVHPFVESVRANRAFGDEEIVQDINVMNIKIGQLEYHLFQTPWDYDTVALVKDRAHGITGEHYEEYDPATDTYKPRPPHATLRLDSTAFDNKLNANDSLVKINDTLYLVYSTPSYAFVNSYRADDYTRRQLLGSFEIYHAVRSHQPTPDEQATIKKELGLLLQKYRYPDTWSGRPEIDADDGPFEIVNKKYWTGNIENSISNIVGKKYHWNRNYPEYARVFFYITLGITLLIFIFRHSTIRTFFMSVLTAVLLTIFTALVLAFFHANDSTVFAWIISYIFLFFLGSLLTWYNKKRMMLTGIWINLFVFFITILPILIISWYYAWKKEQAYARDIPFEYPDFYRHMLFAEIGGALLLLVLLATYIHRVYRRWYSLPED
jgi:hypothetical protein